MCVAYPAVDELIKNGAVLGACVAEEVTTATLDGFMVYPNPFVNDVSVRFTSDEKAGATVEVYAEGGAVVYSEVISIHKGYNKVELNLSFLTAGTYVVVVKGSSLTPVSGTIIKQ